MIGVRRCEPADATFLPDGFGHERDSVSKHCKCDRKSNEARESTFDSQAAIFFTNRYIIHMHRFGEQ